MGLLDMALGNCSAISADQAQREYAMLLAPGERIEQAFQDVRDRYLLTTTRFIFVDKKGLTGKKTEFVSIPYRSIRMFSVETAGTVDTDAELMIWVTGSELPRKLNFARGQNVFALQAQLAAHLMR
ncbi:bacterial Pleckstrin homology domain-containing protein [Tribonema minus]|uniref:Bacterial Pleckstrin homology domain-containing protein n=1 Tax=Tribonema minus TaxID=303371 RepID=A0A836CKG1_9STRA|nr:bacterial Pleckstrin homology domain-containing protein [Tribonema minus]|eukprot:TRINITY_DN6517_c0_g1_i1.p2 TRINITY_DN6517_c0_g1~~TRINITY_DN6517_c0_g1_i1.p2  ORF type:complete len:126 (+),score=26.99 TRINITY_DN6517_c0_g1_i1:170-547(+)